MTPADAVSLSSTKFGFNDTGQVVPSQGRLPRCLFNPDLVKESAYLGKRNCTWNRNCHCSAFFGLSAL